MAKKRKNKTPNAHAAEMTAATVDGRVDAVVEAVDAVEQDIKDGRKQVDQLKKDLVKANNEFRRDLIEQIAKSRTLTEKANAKPDDLSQKTAKLSAAGKNFSIDNGGALDRIVQALAAGMAKAVTDMRALGLPAKEFAAKTLAILKNYENGINTDPALNLDDDKNAAKAKAAILDILSQHKASVTGAGELSPNKLLGNALKSGLKQGIADRVKALPGMATMDKLASVMGLKPVSERINEKLGGKKGSLDQKLTRERAVDAAGVEGEAAESLNSVLGGRTKSRSLSEVMRGDNSPTPVRGGRGMSAGSFAEDTSGALGSDDALGYLKNIEDVLHELWQLGDDAAKRDIEAAQDANEARPESSTDAAAAPVPVGDVLGNAPVAVSKGGSKGGSGGAGAGIGGFVGGLGGGIISGFMKAVGSAASVAGQFVIAMAGFGAGLAAFFIIMAGAAKIIQMFGGGEAIQSLLTNVANGLGELGKINGLGLIAVGLGMISVGAGLVALTGGKIFAGLGNLLTLGDPLGDMAKSLLPYEDIDGKNLMAVGEAMIVLAAGLAAITAAKLVSGIGNLLSGAAGWVAGIFGGDDKPSIIGYLKQFEEIDATKLRATADAASILGKGLLDMASGLENLAKITPKKMNNIMDLTKRAQSLPGGGAQPSEVRTGQPLVPNAPPSTGGGGAGAGAQPMGGGAAPAGGGGNSPTKKMIMRHEGVRYRPYKDSLGLWTVGVGHLIGDGKTLPPEMNREFSQDEVNAMFDEDYTKHAAAARRIPGYNTLGAPAQGALEDLTFNMGPKWYKEWPNFTKQLVAGDTTGAAINLQSSKWYRQVGAGRGNEIVSLIGNDPGKGGGASPMPSSDRQTPFGETPMASNMGAAGTGTLSAPSPQAGPAASTRSAAAVSAGTAGLASAGAAAPMMVANIGGPSAPAPPSVTMMMPIPIPIRPRTEDMVLRAIQSVNYV